GWARGAGRVGGLDLIGHRSAIPVNPLGPPAVVNRTFCDITFGVIPVKQILGALVIGKCIWVLWIGHVGFAPVTEFRFIAWPAVRAINKHHGNCLSLVGHGSCAVFVNEVSGLKPVQAKGSIDPVWFIMGNSVCHSITGSRRAFES